MGNFVGVENSVVIGKCYSSRILLYLESREDMEVLQERWFNDWSEWIEFQAVDVAAGGVGGSAQVRFRVDEDRQNNVPAFGIVDRDILLSHGVMDGHAQKRALFETDHAAFDAAQYLGPYIKVLQRWEMENYLLHPVAMKELVADSGIHHPHCSPDTLTQCLLDLSEAAILLTAANIVLIDHGEKPMAHEFGGTNSDAQDLISKILDHFQTRKLAVPEEVINNNRLKIMAFIRNETDEMEERWDQLNHLIDGKLFLQRFCKWFGFEDPQRLKLARTVHDRDLIDPEIHAFMDGLKREAVQLG